MSKKAVKKTNGVKMVDIDIPRAASRTEDPNVFVSVNGKNYLLPKGKKSRVPEYVAKEIRRSWKATDKFNETADSIIEKSAEKLNQLK